MMCCNWLHLTTWQEGTVGRVHGWARGKVLGGSSAINYNMFSMASKQDLDNWAELGNKGWSFDDMKAYYKKFETYHPASETFGKGMDDKYLDRSLRGTSGPVHVSGHWQLMDLANRTRYLSQKPTLHGARTCGPRL